MARITTGTKRLDLDDSHLFQFAAQVRGHARYGDAPSVILDQSAFYPESGGQLADRGRLGPAQVIDVQIDDAGQLHHLVEGPLPPLGAAVDCAIDERRRRQHMAQHTGQHLLSWALTELADAPTCSSHLGESACTIDVGQPTLSQAQLAQASQAVNELIEADHPLRVFTPPPKELAALPLRRRPKVDADVRVVAVGDFEMVPCGGTHCRSTSEVRLITILGAERYKGMTRVTFAAGERARALLESRSETLAELGRELTCGPLEVPSALARLAQELSEAQQQLGKLRRAYAEEKARGLLERRPSALIVAALPEVDMAMLREVGKRVVAVPGRVALLAAPGVEGTAVFAARSREADLDCGAFMKQITAAVGGRGGGRPDHAEGLLPPDVDWERVVEKTMENSR
jgi:alanyl-tRNA synthetase